MSQNESLPASTTASASLPGTHPPDPIVAAPEGRAFKPFERTRNLFVLGLDEANRKLLSPVAEELNVKLHPLLFDRRAGIEELPDVNQALDAAHEELERFDGTIDGIMSFWDFPGRPIAAYLAHQQGLPDTSLAAVLVCTHKYWARHLQAEVLNQCEIPRFAAFDPFAYEPGQAPEPAELGLEFPFWIKPVGAYCSMYAYRIKSQEQFAEALAQMREGVEAIGKPLDQLMHRLAPGEVPPEVAKVRGHYCLAEQELSGQLCTLEGYVWRGEVHVLGVFDSFKYPDFPSFERYQYPSALPPSMQQRLYDTTRHIMRQFEYDHGTFNIEFFCDLEARTAHVLEVNSRLSQSHAALFEIVYGMPNLKVMMDIALDRAPVVLRGEGSDPMAALYFYRRQGDAIVRSVPSKQEIAELEARHPYARIQPAPLKPGMRLSELPNQDEYSYDLARVIISGQDDTEIRGRYEACIRELPFEFEELEEQ